MPERVVDGSILPLIVIKRKILFRYCPLAINYSIQYEIIPQEDTINYCRQEPFYYFPENKTTVADGYCEIDVEAIGFVIEEKTTVADGYCLLTPPDGSGYIPLPKTLLADGYCETTIAEFDPNVNLVKATIVEGYCNSTIPIELFNIEKTTLADDYCSLEPFNDNNFVIVEKTTLADGYCSLEPFIE